MNQAEEFLLRRLNERNTGNRLRKLQYSQAAIDFCSNDYLGFARSEELRFLIDEALHHIPARTHGSTGSRLLSGNDAYTQSTEEHIAQFHQAEAALLFNSGYDANIGLLSAVPQKGDTILCDELIHASLIDGARLSHANRIRFKHNDLQALETKLQMASGLCYVVVESIYSMDGDAAPLQAISALCRQYKAHLIVDEAHAVGIFGKHGAGLIQELGLEDQVFARIVTYGKALGCHGAAVLGSTHLRNYLINFARSFIYTTAAPLHQIAAIHCAYGLLSQQNLQASLHQKIAYYNTRIAESRFKRIKSNSCIQTVLLNSELEARNAAKKLQEKGFDVRAILSPTVAPGSERLRICLHQYNSKAEINDLTVALNNLT